MQLKYVWLQQRWNIYHLCNFFHQALKKKIKKIGLFWPVFFINKYQFYIFNLF